MGRRSLVFSVVLALVFAGCVDSPEDSEDSTNGDGPAIAEDGSVSAPEWNVGDHWEYRSLGAEGSGERFSLVVSGEQGGDWLMETTDADVAYHHARFEISYMGEIRKADLAGSQAGNRVKFFDFPLEDGKSWTTTWDGLSVRVTAEEVGEGVFELTSMDGDRVHAAYTYDHEVGFFKQASWMGEGGDVMWGMELVGQGESFSGDLVRYRLGPDHGFVMSVEDSQLLEHEIPAEWNEVGMRALLLCNEDEAGQILVGVNSPSDDEIPLPMLPTLNEPDGGASLDCSTGQQLDSAWLMENPGGTWEIGFIVGAPNGVAHLFLEPRAREVFPFPS
jgi:hypothetical protein